MRIHHIEVVVGKKKKKNVTHADGIILNFRSGRKNKFWRAWAFVIIRENACFSYPAHIFSFLFLRENDYGSHLPFELVLFNYSKCNQV